MTLTIEQALQQGVAAHKEGKLQEAERLYRAILQSQPAHPDANHNLGLIAVSVNQAESALPLFKMALGTNPKIEQFWLSYITALIKEKQFDNARQVLEQAKKQGVAGEKLNVLEGQLSSINEPDNVVSLSPPQEQLSSLLEHYQNGRFGDAEKLAIFNTHEFPNHNFSWKILGAVYTATGRNSKAVIANQKTVELSPQDAEAHYNLGVSLQDSGMLKEAKSSYRRAIVLKPDFGEAYGNLGRTLQELGKLEESGTIFGRLILLKPDDYEAHSNLGNVRQELGRMEEAETSYTRAILLRPDYADAHNNLGILLREMGRLEEAEASYGQAIVFKPDFAEAHSNLGIMLQELGRLDESEASCRQAIVLKPDYAEAHYNLGITLSKLGRLDETEASYTQAIALKPNFAEAYSNLGNLLKELGRLDLAEASYTQAIALKPDFSEAHSNLGITLKELGRFDEAEASLRQAIGLKPDFPSAKHILAALTGETTAAAPLDYVESLFDNYAAKFETSLVENLEYKIPRLFAEIILKDSQSDLLGSIIDIGCGTGLFGMEIKQFCNHLEGVDLSQKMLDKAKEKNVYNKLIKQDIVGYLLNASLNFDYFISLDVFVYIGDLSDVFRLIKLRNKTGGKLAFSTEDYDGEGFFLGQSGRYSHSKKYVESLCKTFGYELRHFETQVLRKEKNKYISGGLYLLDF
jgi:predicted TPR repeat methyltransferase/thioredoxin-like negative regulator of GroEL